MMIISISRRTDIPAFYTPWLMQRMKAGEVFVRNPYRPHQVSRIRLSPKTIDGLVFWSKNPAPLLPYLSQFSPYPFYIQFTLTPYGKELEPNIPDKFTDQLRTFEKLAKKLKPGQLVWRYDPILLNEKYTLSFHLQAFQRFCSALSGMTDLCILSFIDLYPSIKNTVKKCGIEPIPHTTQLQILQCFIEISQPYRISLAACAERTGLPIAKASCIDPQRLSSIAGRILQVPKAKGQRPECGCCESVDIGSYRTCPGGCVYCYANQGSCIPNTAQHDPNQPLLHGTLSEADTVTDRTMPLYGSQQISMF